MVSAKRVGRLELVSSYSRTFLHFVCQIGNIPKDETGITKTTQYGSEWINILATLRLHKDEAVHI